LTFSDFWQAETLGVGFRYTRDKTLRRSVKPEQHLKYAIRLGYRFALLLSPVIVEVAIG
jgi:hypothetical protein